MPSADSNQTLSQALSGAGYGIMLVGDRTYVLSRDKIKALAVVGQRFAVVSAEQD